MTEGSQAPAESDWTDPRTPGVPPPTGWPAVVALSVVVFSFGMLTSWVISAVGLAAFAFSVGHWMEELDRDT